MKSVKYVVKISGVVKFSSRISRIEDYPTISKIEYDYNQYNCEVSVKVYSKQDIVDVDKFLATITNHAVPDYSKATVQIISDSWISRIIRPIMLDIEIDSYGLISRLRNRPTY